MSDSNGQLSYVVAGIASYGINNETGSSYYSCGAVFNPASYVYLYCCSNTCYFI